MLETDGRVSSHHVEIASAILIPNVNALTAHESNRQRLVVCRAVARFEGVQTRPLQSLLASRCIDELAEQLRRAARLVAMRIVLDNFGADA